MSFFSYNLEYLLSTPTDPFQNESRVNADGKLKDGAKKKIKECLDQALDVFHFFKNLNIKNRDFKKGEEQDLYWKKQVDGWLELYDQKEPHISRIYNKTRNYLTKKPYSLEKYKLNFENASLAGGWDKNKETANTCLIFKKGGLFYLGILNKQHNTTFEDLSRENVRKLIIKEDQSLEKYKKNLGNQNITSKKREEINQNIRLSTEKIEDLELLLQEEVSHYIKMNYKLLPGASKMLPKVFFANNNYITFQPSEEIKKIKENKLYTKENIKGHDMVNLHKYIDFCKKSLLMHQEWNTAFDFSNYSFKKTEDYESIDQFYREVDQRGYTVTFENIPETYIHAKIKRDQLSLFQIYNKDFSPHSKGRDNLHTAYWKLLFDEENLKDVVLKLSGRAELFYRRRSLKNPFKHEEGSVLKHKRYATEWEKLGLPIGKLSTERAEIEKNSSIEIRGERHNLVFYGGKEIGRIILEEGEVITKDRRFSKDKFFFHCPINLNYKAAGTPNINKTVNRILKENSDINIIGIDRGEKHLLYYSIINPEGEILKDENGNYLQGSLNVIASNYEKNGETIAIKTDYQKMLDLKEGARKQERKDWENIENIKELKAGYLSQVVHKLCELITKYNAIVILEDLNFGFKRGRFKVEKQVYQKFEKALIDKLNYLVFKDRPKGDLGGYLKAYQLTNKFKSFQKLGRQSGILFYVTASYTSKVDPVTGYIQNLYPKLKEPEKIKEFFNKFDLIQYNGDYFMFTYDLKNLKGLTGSYSKDDSEIPQKTIWTVCSCVERSKYTPLEQQKSKNNESEKNSDNQESKSDVQKKGSHKLFNVNDKLKALFEKHKIEYPKEKELKEIISSCDDPKFLKSFMYYFSNILRLRVTDSEATAGTDKNDFIQSPVHPFYDSREVQHNGPLPNNGDANGAYNIARKGVILIDKITNEALKIKINKKEWQDYSQKEEIVQRQIKKYEKINK